jgi:hypothetical protein
MKFKEIYELTDLIAGNADAITFKAFETFSGREVYVHMLQAAAPISADALAGAGIEVIDSGRYREQPFIITPAITDFSGLGGLLDRKRSRPPAKEPSDFTGMFQTEKSSEPGEFTRMFQSGGPSKPSPMPATPPESSEPGEFTRLFQSGGPSKPSAKPHTPSEQLKPPPPPPAASTTAPEGEFTRLFHPPAPKQTSWTPPAAAKPAEPEWAPKLRWEDGGAPLEAATGVFAPPVERKKAPPSDEAGPSDFTRVISSSRPARQPAAPPAAPESPVPVPQSTAVDTPPPAPTTPSYLPLILILGGFFLLALFVVLYFALRG